MKPREKLSQESKFSPEEKVAKEAPLSTEWLAIIKQYNISSELAFALRKTAKEQNCLVGMRLDKRDDQPVQRETAPKPVIVKLKVANWGWMQGNVPYDQQSLAKTKRGIIQPMEDQQEKMQLGLPDARIKLMTKTIALQDILYRIAQGFETVVEEKAPNYRAGYLTVKTNPSVGDNPAGNSVYFRIKMDDTAIKPIQGEVNPSMKYAKPAWWKKEWGHFKEALKNEYPVQYQAQTAGEFADLKIYAVPVKADVHQPIGKDNDGLLATIPLDKYNARRSVAKPVNTFTEKHAFIDLIKKVIEIRHDCAEIDAHGIAISPPRDIRNKMRSSISSFGSGSGWEFNILHLINSEMQNVMSLSKTITASTKLQHSWENRNPGKASDIDALALFVCPNGEPTVTKNEKKAIEHLAEYPNQIFHVNKSWDMALSMWGQIVDKQIKMGIDVAPDTMTAFLKQITLSNQKLDLETVSNSVKLAENSVEVRDQLKQYLIHQFEVQRPLTYENVGFEKLGQKIIEPSSFRKFCLQFRNDQESNKALVDAYNHYVTSRIDISVNKEPEVEQTKPLKLGD